MFCSFLFLCSLVFGSSTAGGFLSYRACLTASLICGRVWSSFVAEMGDVQPSFH